MESMARVARESGVLSRLANLLHQYSDSDELIRSTVASLVNGISADQVSVWLVGASGRLKCAGSEGVVPDEHLLASLAVEKRKAEKMDRARGLLPSVERTLKRSLEVLEKTTAEPDLDAATAGAIADLMGRLQKQQLEIHEKYGIDKSSDPRVLFRLLC